jgi:hypothetical protein
MDFILSKDQDRQCCATFVAVQNNKYYFSENVLVALGIQHVKRMRQIVMWPARMYNIFHTIPKPHDFRKQKCF